LLVFIIFDIYEERPSPEAGTWIKKALGPQFVEGVSRTRGGSWASRSSDSVLLASHPNLSFRFRASVFAQRAFLYRQPIHHHFEIG
jgi:hypothetical protein